MPAPSVRWWIGASIFVLGVALCFLTSDFWLQTGAGLIFLGGMAIAISGKKKN